jgi:hypothetical protein
MEISWRDLYKLYEKLSKAAPVLKLIKYHAIKTYKGVEA